MLWNLTQKLLKNLLKIWENQLDLKILKTKTKTNLHIINQIHNKLPIF
jgi:hypothetical protein